MYKLRFCFLSRGYCNAPVTSESGRTIKNDFSVWTLFGHLTEENCCLWQKYIFKNLWDNNFLLCTDKLNLKSLEDNTPTTVWTLQ